MMVANDLSQPGRCAAPAIVSPMNSANPNHLRTARKASPRGRSIWMDRPVARRVSGLSQREFQVALHESIRRTDIRSYVIMNPCIGWKTVKAEQSKMATLLIPCRRI